MVQDCLHEPSLVLEGILLVTGSKSTAAFCYISQEELCKRTVFCWISPLELHKTCMFCWILPQELHKRAALCYSSQ